MSEARAAFQNDGVRSFSALSCVVSLWPGAESCGRVFCFKRSLCGQGILWKPVPV